KLAPFYYGDTQYNIASAVVTAGVPIAAFKYVSKYNALGAYKVSKKLYKSCFIVMTITGFIGFFILYLLAPTISTITLANKSVAIGGWSVEDITWIIRIISMVVIFIPLLAIWRSVFQG